MCEIEAKKRVIFRSVRDQPTAELLRWPIGAKKETEEIIRGKAFSSGEQERGGQNIFVAKEADRVRKKEKKETFISRCGSCKERQQ